MLLVTVVICLLGGCTQNGYLRAEKGPGFFGLLYPIAEGAGDIGGCKLAAGMHRFEEKKARSHQYAWGYPEGTDLNKVVQSARQTVVLKDARIGQDCLR